ncbi:hypothetical protein SASPL_110247 [Salvia splendens]|uniref:Gag1-like clamp domain-containing protein n=1 Tax=Salvia splendens TaxID=180675 RepID=A0A8X8Y6W5_SALSN|nr:uncharacterized protein LOC121799770 [Salvia splendens]KAG6426034.1 hypothetical protein SASPL_110247 [Salvia splendens]
MKSSPTCFGLRMSSRDAPTPKHANQVAVCSKESTEYVNPGLRLWNETREKWVADKKIVTRSHFLHMLKLRSICMDTKLHLCSATTCKDMQRLLNSPEPFPTPVPLGEMVDFLVNVWDDEGMYEMI